MKKLLLITVITVLFACKESSNKDNIASEINEPESVSVNTQGDFVHSVYFWLHNPKKTEDRMAFESSLMRFINSSENIMTKHVGLPAATDRDVIDNTYTYSLLLTFKDKDAQDRYQEEPAHKQFIEDSSKLWKKVLVYDSENILQD